MGILISSAGEGTSSVPCLPFGYEENAFLNKFY